MKKHFLLLIIFIFTCRLAMAQTWIPAGTNVHNVSHFTTFDSGSYFAGSFDTAGTIANRVAKWDGTNWSRLGTDFNSQVIWVETYNSELYVGGKFTAAGTGSANNIASWDGTNWSALGSGMDSQVVALSVYQGSLFAGGQFSIANGTSVHHIAKMTENLAVSSFPSINNISVYPNPVTNKLTIENLPTGSSILLTDIEGRKVYKTTFSDKQGQIDLSSLTAGMYFLKVEHQNGIIKIIKVN